jgi:hypothetical protein
MIKTRGYRYSGNDVYDRVGLAWLDPEAHTRMQEIILQPHDIPWNFERWRQIAENQERIWKKTNRLVLPIVIDPDTFLEWCAARTRQPNGVPRRIRL